MKRWLGLLAALGISFAAAAAEDRAEPEKLKVLTIGNSFADSVFTYLPRIAGEMNAGLVLERANLPGCPLRYHWELAERGEKAYGGKSLDEILSSREWDVVTLQQASGFSWQRDSYEPHLTNLINYVKKYAPSAEIVLQQTWSYRFDEPRLAGWGISPKRMYEKLSDAYRLAAEDHSLRQIPTGYAVELARDTQQPKLVEFDLEKVAELVYPDALPDQTGSLVNGIWWGKDEAGKWTIRRDSYHLNPRGQYLQACLWFGFLFDRNPEEIGFVPEKLTAEDAAFLRGVARRALSEFRQAGE